MRIRTKTGEVIDLDEERRLGESLYSSKVLGILDALEAACSVPGKEYRDGLSRFEHERNIAHNAALGDVREAAGVVEEGAP